MTAPVDLEELKKEQKDRSDDGHFYSDIPIYRLLELIAELEAARVDAARYRWLRTPHDDRLGGCLYPFAIDKPRERDDENSTFEAELDALVDAARKEST